MAEAIELFKQDGVPAGIFYCSECRSVYANREGAEFCHVTRLCSCGKETQGGFSAECAECWRKRSNEERAAQELKRFEKATKIAAKDYTGDMVYDNDHYYEDVEEAIDQYLEGQEPEYVWACKDVGIPLASSECITERLVENMWEDAEASDLNGLDELDAAIDAFNEANKSIHVYQPDYTTAILVKPC